MSFFTDAGNFLSNLGNDIGNVAQKGVDILTSIPSFLQDQGSSLSQRLRNLFQGTANVAQQNLTQSEINRTGGQALQQIHANPFPYFLIAGLAIFLIVKMTK